MLVSGSLAYVLIGALDISVPVLVAGCLVTAGSLICFGSSRIIARVVEKKAHTSTIGGAFFAGFLTAPWLISAANGIAGTGAGLPIPVMPVLAATSAAYMLAEGLGRLSCISFGCCYGRPVSQLHPVLRKLFDRHSFIFSGRTKKISYEAGLDGTRVVPIQAITSVFLVVCGLAAAYLFLNALYGAAFLLATIFSQVWRCVSETLRADYRGGGRVTAYQVMAAFTVSLCPLDMGDLPRGDRSDARYRCRDRAALGPGAHPRPPGPGCRPVHRFRAQQGHRVISHPLRKARQDIGDIRPARTSSPASATRLSSRARSSKGRPSSYPPG